MTISVVIPTYNRVDFITKAIESVLNQSIRVDEIIVVDDGSTDETAQTLKRFDEITYIYQNNSGVSSARNRGIKASSGEWITFLDSDDCWEKDKIASQKKFHEENPTLLISHTDEEWIRDNKKINKPKKFQKIGGNIFDLSLDYTFVGTSTIMLKKEIFDTIGFYDENLIACEDFDIFLRIAQRYEFGYINQKLTKKIAGHAGQLSFDTDFLDLYRVKALLKFHEDIRVKKVIEEKVDILKNGAKKHNNFGLLQELEKIIKI